MSNHQGSGSPSPDDARRDDTIAKAVRHALECEVLVPHARIRTSVTDGVVVLEGDVESTSQREDAERCVRELFGVRDVENLLVVRPAGMPSEDALQTQIEHALTKHALRSAAHVRVVIRPGKVTLRGHVASWPEKQAVEGAVRAMPGVTEFESHLRVL
jgi:osmotically-inducible protein OsmY